MERLTANLSKAKVQRRTVHGREFLVAPITILAPGVLNGSKGALYYPPEEIARNHADWNGIPILINHSVVNGSSVSGRDPKVWETQGVGHVYNSRITRDGRQVVDGYFDVTALRKVNSSVYDRLMRGEPVSVSTGLFTQNEPAKGSDHRGRNYTHVARGYKPDHLAILPDQPGACSIEDGCGVLLNQSNKTQTNGGRHMTPEQKKEIVDGLISNCDCGWAEDDREVLNGFPEGKLLAMDAYRKTSIENETLVANAKAMIAKEEEVCNEDDEECAAKKDEEAKPPFMAENQLPESIRNELAEAREIVAREKQLLIDALTANVKDKEPVVNALKDKSLADLRALQALVPKSVTANYAGSAGAAATHNAPVKIAPLGNPHQYA